MNPFANIISPLFLQTFNNSIDSLLVSGSLSIPCVLKYNNGSAEYCSNCIYDQITKTSSNRYNNTGPGPFANNTICPVCLSLGQVTTNTFTEVLHLATIFDSKYFMNISNKTVQIPDGAIQTLCSSEYLPKLRSANELSIQNTEQYGHYTYERAGDPSLMGLGDTHYCMIMWRRK